MKTVILSLRILSAVLVAAVALALVIVEGALLISGDFLLYERPVAAFLRLSVRLILPTATLIIALLSIIRRRSRYLFEGFCLLGSTALTAPFLSNHFGLYFIALAALFTLSQLLDRSPRPLQKIVDHFHKL
jgi:hypothetical protein